MTVLRYIFNFACYATACGMTVLWLYRYSLDEDNVQFHLKSFNFQERQYPILSFCFFDPFIESKLQTYNKTLTREKYKEILYGSTSYNGANSIVFDDVTRNLADFHLGEGVGLSNGTIIEDIHPDYPGLPQVTYAGFRNKNFIKCFGLQAKFKNLDYMFFGFNSSLYPNGIRPTSKRSTWVILHLPNQISLSWSSGKNSWPKRYEKKEYYMVFKLQQIDILKRRNKRKYPCLSDDLDFDQVVLDDYLEKVGCKAPYQRTNKSFKICASKEKIAEANSNHIRGENPIKPCTSASSMIFSYDENDYKSNRSDVFNILLFYPNQYREIRMVQAIDLQTVIGNAGGYIGLFLGMPLSVLIKLMWILQL